MSTNNKTDKKPLSQYIGNSESISTDDVTDKETKDKIDTLIDLTEAVLEDNKKIKKRLTIMAIGSYIRLFVILIPLILGIIYLPSFFKNTFGDYSEIFQSVGSNGGSVGQMVNLLNSLSDDQANMIIKQLGQ